MQFNYQAMETSFPTSNHLSEAPPLYYFTDTNNNTHPVYTFPNPQMFQNHHQFSVNYNPLLPHQYRIANNTSQPPHFDHQFSQLTLQPREPQQQSAAAGYCDETRPETTINVGHSQPMNYCFRLGPSNESNDNHSANDERDFANHHHHHGQIFMVPKFCRQARDDDLICEEYSYSTSATKEPFHWNNYAAMDDIPNGNEKNNTVDDVMMRENNISNLCNNSINNYKVIDERKQLMRFYSTELEAIYGIAKNNNSVNLGETSYNQTGSSSALTSENSPVGANLLDHATPFCDDKEASDRRNHELHKKKRKWKRKQLLNSMTSFFEDLVENVMSHQDRLHGKFMEAVERLERERSEREEAWRNREAQAQSREAVARVQEQAMASAREALIVSYLEKITGQRVDLSVGELSNDLEELSENRRWPGREIVALMRIRRGLEAKFEDDHDDQLGLMSPIWEEVSDLMASMGYKRSAKSCKGKWEFIYKYLSSNSTKAFSCNFDNDLEDQILPVSSPQDKNDPFSSTSNLCSKDLVGGFGVKRQSYVELLKAFATQPCSTSVEKLYEVSQMGSGGLNFDKEEFEDELVEEDQEDNLAINNED